MTSFDDAAAAIGAELRASGATFTGAVCMNLLRHPAWGRAQETYGEDPCHLGEMAAALTRGLQRHVMACMKHFACNSMENARFKVDVVADERALHEVYLPHFKRVASEGVAAVMSAYNSLNGHWCGDSYPLLTGILREDWGWDGLVITDFIMGLRDPVESVRAGCNIEMPFRQQRDPVLGDAVFAWKPVRAPSSRYPWTARNSICASTEPGSGRTRRWSTQSGSTPPPPGGSEGALRRRGP